MGYIESTAGEDIVQPASALWGIQLTFAVIPSALILATLVCAMFYRLREDDLTVAAMSEYKDVSIFSANDLSGRSQAEAGQTER